MKEHDFGLIEASGSVFCNVEGPHATGNRPRHFSGSVPSRCWTTAGFR